MNDNKDSFEILTMGPKEVERQKKLNEEKAKQKKAELLEENQRRARKSEADRANEESTAKYAEAIEKMRGGKKSRKSADEEDAPDHIKRDSDDRDGGGIPRGTLSQFHPLNFVNKRY
jgi:hypothetical protein